VSSSVDLYPPLHVWLEALVDHRSDRAYKCARDLDIHLPDTPAIGLEHMDSVSMTWSRGDELLEPHVKPIACNPASQTGNI
jgi:hypothetical protein